MTLKEHIQINAGINEGLKYFKLSKRIDKFIKKVNKKSEKHKDKQYYPLLKNLTTKLQLTSKKMKVIENDFSLKKINREDAKKRVEPLKKEVLQIFNFFKKIVGIKEFKDSALLKIIIITISTLLLGLFAFNFSTDLVAKTVAQMSHDTLSEKVTITALENLLAYKTSGVTDGELKLVEKTIIEKTLKELYKVFNKGENYKI